MTDPAKVPSKKTEMIEVRVSWETKRDLLTACQREGRTISDVIRSSIDDFIRTSNQPPKGAEVIAFPPALPKPIRRGRYLAAGAIVVGASLLAALPSAAAPDLAKMFQKLDANSDGVLTADEFAAAPGDMKRVDIRKLKQGGAAPAANAAPSAYVVLSDLDGRAEAARRAVRFQSSASPQSSADRRRASFANYDTNADGRVDLPEYRTVYRTMLANGFARLDADDSNSLDADEYGRLSADILAIPIDAIPALGIDGSYGPIMSPDSLKAEFTRLDANVDGKLSLEEYLPQS